MELPQRMEIDDGQCLKDIDCVICLEQLVLEVVSTKKLINMAKRWQNFAAKQRKRISFLLKRKKASTSSSSRVAKGHFVIYTADQARFIIPLAYPETRPLHNFQTSLKKEFGLAILHYPVIQAS
nr:auxin-responsive protein SAUR68-like [Solanum lycopersicum]